MAWSVDSLGRTSTVRAIRGNWLKEPGQSGYWTPRVTSAAQFFLLQPGVTSSKQDKSFYEFKFGPEMIPLGFNLGRRKGAIEGHKQTYFEGQQQFYKVNKPIMNIRIYIPDVLIKVCMFYCISDDEVVFDPMSIGLQRNRDALFKYAEDNLLKIKYY
ncbi:hypothetical protein NDU88_007424 [Pleurodeles waltl]|uniref:Uncharacterized protein n=1 Tax=Pleurodeles waltl TaxID=8319 RepID=A0AAV7SSP3_PLEWA|nr:hypothetical protein NDU88_007424 [Pleurodeles waltl]